MKTPQKILLLPICGLGDAVWYLPFLRAIRANLPKAEVTVVVATAAAGSILKGNTANVEVVVFNRGAEKRRLGTLLSLLLGIRSRKFDIAISGAHPNSVRVPLFALLSGSKTRVGARSERLSFLYNRCVDVSTDAHYVDRYQQLLKGIGIVVSKQESTPRLRPPMEAKASAMSLWKAAGLEDSKLVIGMVSGADTNARGRWQPYLKRWNNQGFAEAAKWASSELGAKVLMIGSASEGAIAEDIAGLAGIPIVNLCGKTGLGELQWVISKCAAIVSNDTGTMHLAGALGTQVLALFGPTSPASFRPPGEHNRIIQGQAVCSPCYPHPTCDLKKCLAMDNISTSQVTEGILALLNSAKTVQQDR